jgi:murein DD-endopeptidase MepM/ murein hydrolase activator NlpD
MGNPVDDVFITCKWDVKGKKWKAGRHTGIDYRAARGTEIKAIADGKVVYCGRGAGWGGAYGLQVIVQHGDARVIYAHLSSINIKGLRSKIVKEGDLLGLSGATGNAVGPHLHLEARKAPYRYNIDAINPMPIITGEPEPEDAPKPAKKASTTPKETKSDETI